MARSTTRWAGVSLVLATTLILHVAANNMTDGYSRGIESRRPRGAHAELNNEGLNRFIVVPEYKLLFCYIEKVACSSFNRLFAELRGQRSTEGRNGRVRWYLNTPEMHKMEKGALERILVDSTWHKAVFYREPLERFLSGYRSKCEPGHDFDMGHCASEFDPEFRTQDHVDEHGNENASIWHRIKPKNISFVDAVTHLAQLDRDEKAEDQQVDVHWKRQARFCGGLENTLQYYDTVEELRVETARRKVIKMLTKVGVPLPIRSSVPHFDALFPPPWGAATGKKRKKQKSGSLAGGGPAGHGTVAGASLEVYYTSTALSTIVMEHYMEDYLLFGIKAPAWANASLPASSAGNAG